MPELAGHVGAALAITSCAVVVPARNEELLLTRCLTALDAARTRAAQLDPGLQLSIVVVLDSCTDGSAEIAAGFPGVDTVTTRVGDVGAARQLGCELALARSAAPPPRTWLACTDADSAVPAHWLLTHLRLAAGGADLVLGTVLPDVDELTGQPFDRWLDDYPQRDGHPHVHGANLGVRGEMYHRAGGFGAGGEHEDVVLAQAVRCAGGRVVSTAASPVLTSGRHQGRTPGGFARWLTTRAGLR